MKRLFFSQSMLDSMVEAGRVRVEGNIMTMLAGDNPSFLLLAACRIVRTIENGPDPAGLVSQVRSEAELKEMGAEIYMDSVLYREVAYQADPGFIAQREAPGGTQEAAAAKQAPGQPAAEAPGDKTGNADDLSRYLLDNLL